VSFIFAIAPVKSYTEGIVGQPESFFPSQAVSQNDTTISQLIYRGLFKYDIYGTLVPDLADSWSISSDGLVYTITLKENQRWSDGSPIVADDLIYTAFKSRYLQDVGTDKVDDLTVRYILPNKFSPFISLLTKGVMKDGSEEEYNPLSPVSSGPFRVVRVSKSGKVVKEVMLYSETANPEIKKISFRYYSSEDELELSARLGEIDAFMSSQEHQLENFDNKKFPLQGIYFALFLNLDNEGLSELEFREDLRATLNINELIYDRGINVEGPISRSIYTDPDIDYDKYNKGLRDDLDGKELVITIPDLKNHKQMAERIKGIWEDKLKVNVKIQKRDPTTFIEDVINKRDYQILLYGQAVGRDPDRYINWHSTQKEFPGLNLSNFDQVRADRALEEGRNAIDTDQRLIHYNEFQKVIDEYVPAIFLYHPYANFYVSKHITGVGEKYTFTAADRFLDFMGWKK